MDHAVTPGTDRRQEARLQAADIARIDRVRLRPGREVRLVDLSSPGVALESRMALAPGTDVSLSFEGRGWRRTITARVGGCHVVVLDSTRGLVYRSGLRLAEDVLVGMREVVTQRVEDARSKTA